MDASFRLDDVAEATVGLEPTFRALKAVILPAFAESFSFPVCSRFNPGPL